jgi:hypothetical protein
MAAANDTKVDNVKNTDQVKTGDGSASGENARSEAVSSFKPIEAGTASAINPVTDGKMAMAAGDETTRKYFDSVKSPEAQAGGDTSAIQPTDFTPPTGEAGDKKGDRVKDGAKEPLGDVAREYSETLKRSGLSEKQAEEFTRSTLERLRGTDNANDSAIKGTPEEQMARMNKAMTDILDGAGKRPDGSLANGQPDYLSQRDRQNVVADLAAREADPSKYVTQGEHNTCVLQSGQKQRLEGGDPAKVAEDIASVVNRGYAEIKEKDGTTRQVNVDSRSFAPDKESRQNFSTEFHGDAGKRGMAGHVYDALAGQTVADLRAEREGKPTSASGIDKASYVYMAAHADQVGAAPGQTRTNEALMARDASGNLKFKANSPEADIWQTAHLNRAMGGDNGAVFAHQSVVGDGRPPAGYPEDMRVTTFGSSAELSQKLKAYESATGQSGQILVNSPFLPGGGENGHGLHAMNARADANGNFKLDNNWAGQFDLGNVSAAAMDKATNSARWQPKGQGGHTPDGGSDKADPVPTDRTVIKPGAGRNPNESDQDWNQRLLEEQKLRDEKAKEEKLKEEKEKNPLEGNKEKAAADVAARYNAAMAAYKETIKVNPLAKPPSLDDFK